MATTRLAPEAASRGRQPPRDPAAARRRGARRCPASWPGLVRVHTRDAPLRPVARMTTTRQRADPARPGGRIARRGRGRRRIRADAGPHHGTVPLAGGRGGADRRRPAAARGGRRTATPHDGLRPAGRAAKLERALSGWLPKPPNRPAPTASSSAGEVVLAYLRAQAETADGAGPSSAPRRARRRPSDAGRRAPAAQHAPVLPARPRPRSRPWTGRRPPVARRRARRGARRRGAGRIICEPACAGPPWSCASARSQARIQGHFASVRAAARTELLAALDSERYFSLLDDLDRPAGRAAVHRRRRPGRRRRAPGGGPARPPPGGPADAPGLASGPGPARNEALHQARKSARRARYASRGDGPGDRREGPPGSSGG